MNSQHAFRAASSDYGADPNQFANPFKKEGYLFLIRGGTITLLGISLLFIASAGLRATDSRVGAGVQIFTALGLLAAGLFAVLKGWQQTFKFIVDRGVVDLPPNLPPQDPSDLSSVDAQLSNMLEARKNLAFISPVGLVPQALERFFPQFMYVPYPLRNMAHRVTASAAYTAIGVVLYLFSLLSEYILTGTTNISSWLGLVLVGWLLVIWYRNQPTKANFYDNYVSQHDIRNAVLFVGIGVVAPVLLSVVGAKFPPAPFNPLVWFVTLLVLGGAVATTTILLVKIRSEYTNSRTTISEYTGDNKSYLFHPKNLFRFFDNAMVKKRYFDRPNRVYSDSDPYLDEESVGNGSFVGQTLMETQPALRADNLLPTQFTQIQWVVAIAGQALCVLSAVAVVIIVSGATILIPQTAVLAFLFWVFGNSLISIAHTFWAEVSFTSYLVHFWAQGTYSSYQQGIGNKRQSNLSANANTVQTSLTPTLRVSKITSIGFASPRAPFLGVNRYISDMEADDQFLKTLWNDVELATATHNIAGGVTQKQIETVSRKQVMSEDVQQNIFLANAPMVSADYLIQGASLGIENKRWKVKHLPFDVTYLFRTGDGNPPFRVEMTQNGRVEQGVWEVKAPNLIELQVGGKTFQYEISELTSESVRFQTPNTPMAMELEMA